MDDNHDEFADQQVDAFLDRLQTRYGLTPTDVTNLLQFSLRLQKRMAFGEKLGEWTAKLVVASVVTGFMGFLGWAVIHAIQALNGKV